MDFAQIFTEYFSVIVVLGCLVVGYAIKHAPFLEKISNNYIPCIMIILGAVLMVVESGLTLDNIIIGGFLGAASTGLHQAFTRFVEKQDTEK